jgi:RNA-directed DNA polymerase
MVKVLEPRPVPVGATVDEALNAQALALCEGAPLEVLDRLPALERLLAAHEAGTSFDAAWRVVIEALVARREALLGGDDQHKRALLRLLARYATAEEASPLLRRLVRDPSVSVRARAGMVLRRLRPVEVALPRADGEGWDSSGWSRGVEPGRLARHTEQGRRAQEERGVLPLATVGEVCEALRLSPGQLRYLCCNNDGFKAPYRSFTRPKRDGGERVICAPKGQLKAAQRAILAEILAKVPVHDAAHGFVPGRSTATAAAPHVGRAILLKFDLKDFFPSLTFFRVVGLYASLGYTVGRGLVELQDLESRAVAPLLAKLTTYSPTPASVGEGWAPQGAPTSPALSNLACRALDARLEGLARSVGGVYTRYADDLTISLEREPGGGVGRLRWWVDQICHQEGFVVRQDKFRVVRDSQRQQVTGLVVNDALRVPREARRRLRAALHNCRRDGVAAHAEGQPERLLSWMQGYASYIHMVHPEEGARLLAEVRALRDAQEAP